MGMFDSSQPQQDADLSTYNYQTQADKVKRQRELATTLLQAKQPQGGMVSGWYVKPSMGANIASLAQTLLGAYMNKNADDSQKSLDANSLAASTKQSAGLDAPVRDPNQDALEAQQQLDREASRTAPTNPPDPSDGPVTDRLAPSPPLPADPPSTATPLPPVQTQGATAQPVPSVSSAPAKKLPVKQAAAILASKIATDTGTAPNNGFTNSDGEQTYDIDGNPIGGAPMPSTPAIAAALNPALAPPTPAPQAPPPQAAPQAAPQAPPQAPTAPPPQASAPGMGQLSLNGQPMPNPFSPAPQTAPGQDTLTNGQAVQTSNSDPYSHAPTQEQQVARLIALGRTSPEGQQIAQARLNQMFASKNGRFSTVVHSDPVNGGFMQVTTDTATGATSVQPITPASGGTLITGQTTDANGNRLNIHKDGSTTPVMANGQPVVDSSVTARNDDQKVKIAGAVQSNQNAQAAIDAAINRNNRILDLYHQTATGPIGGLLPDWTSKRQELHALLAQDLFSETRNALAGAGDAGGAPKMAQSEFKYMKDNGGLSQSTNEGAATNIIANMNAQLMRQKQALQDYAGTIGTTTAGQSSVPARGQTVNAAALGFN